MAKINLGSGTPRSGPVRITRMRIVPADPRPSANVPLAIAADLDPGPDQEEWQWWMEQLRERANVHSWSRSSTGLTSVRVEAPDDQVEAAARRLLTAVAEANAAYSERYPAWRREHDAQVAEDRRRQQQRVVAQQAILDRVMDEYRLDQ